MFHFLATVHRSANEDQDDEACLFHVEKRVDGNHLKAILDFCESFSLFLEGLQPTDELAILPASEDQESLGEACLYIGCYMIINTSMTVEAVQQALQRSKAFIQDSVSIKCTPSIKRQIRIVDCWRAVEQAVRLDWLVHPDSDLEPVLDVEELAHYADPTNGGLHMAVPGHMFFFPSPADLPDGQQWADLLADDGTADRRFSAAYYAELFSFEELSVSVVACLGRGSAAAAAAFAARGIDAVDLGLAGDGSSLLRGLDRLLALSRAAPGAVAVHSGDGFEWPEYVGTLVAAFLISREGFDEGSAWAWLRMVSPWMVGGRAAGGVPGLPAMSGPRDA